MKMQKIKSLEQQSPPDQNIMEGWTDTCQSVNHTAFTNTLRSSSYKYIYVHNIDLMEDNLVTHLQMRIHEIGRELVLIP